ncbi:MAG: hypothetical protein R3293_23245, partial [Candidatus Promineifilaceae bacterium]|nr:hypothetical protein [Candidatus Promineifilaceae bacterium]
MFEEPENNNLATDLRGVGQLSIDAVNGITDIVEALHQTIASSAGILDKSNGSRTRGLTRFVYQNVRRTTHLVGAGIDAPLRPLSQRLGDKESSPAREAVLAAVNGLLGDHLVAKNNPLAIPMRLRHNGQAVGAQTLAERLAPAGSHLVIFVHGALMNDRQWQRKGHDHGAALARDLGLMPLYLHYNSGRHVSENGRLFAQLLESFFAQLTQPPTLTLIGFSMGGLVARSACHYGNMAGHHWLNSLNNLLFLGTPHHGAPLEKGGNWMGAIMDISPYSSPFARLGKFRSGGLTDLRYGHVLDEDWQGRDRFAVHGDQRIPVPLPADVNCFAIAASTSKDANRVADYLPGDGLVPLQSALGRHQDSRLDLGIPESRQWVGRPL